MYKVSHLSGFGRFWSPCAPCACILAASRMCHGAPGERFRGASGTGFLHLRHKRAREVPHRAEWPSATCVACQTALCTAPCKLCCLELAERHINELDCAHLPWLLCSACQWK